MSYALVTGAAKGIGKAIATELAKRSYNLILVDVDQKSLIGVATYLASKYTVDVQYLHVDLSEEDAVEKIVNATSPYHHQLDTVVNNAGYGLNVAFEHSNLDEQLNIIDVNIRATVKISHAFIPVLKRFRKSYLLNVGSTTAYQTVPYLNVYASTKAFILAFTRGLRYELRKSTVSVSCLCPGSTDTDFVKRARMSEATLKVAARFNMDPQEVGAIAVKGMLNGKAEIIPGFTNKLHAFLPKFFPKKVVEKIGGDIYGPKEINYTIQKRMAYKIN